MVAAVGRVGKRQARWPRARHAVAKRQARWPRRVGLQREDVATRGAPPRRRPFRRAAAAAWCAAGARATPSCPCTRRRGASPLPAAAATPPAAWRESLRAGHRAWGRCIAKSGLRAANSSVGPMHPCGYCC
eukprot:6716630-Prymnesium_polylepis.1